jgi:hypothetical protein
MYHLLQQTVTLHFVFMGLVCFSVQAEIISLNSVNKLIFVMVKCCVFFAVRTEFLNRLLFKLSSASKDFFGEFMEIAPNRVQ